MNGYTNLPSNMKRFIQAYAYQKFIKVDYMKLSAIQNIKTPL